jgi:chromosome partitioning protein
VGPLAVVNQKGGVGKTTVTVNLAAAFVAVGQRVLVVDLDPQGHATEGLGLGDRYDAEGPLPTLTAALLGRWEGPAADLVVTGAEEIDVIPATVEQFVVEAQLVAVRGREHRLAHLLEQVSPKYDWVLIDCPPSLGALTDNAIVAAGQVLVVAQPQDSSLRALELLLDQVQSIRTGLRVDVEIAGIVLNMWEDTLVARRTMAALEKLPVPILAVLRRRTRLQEAWAQGRSILELEPRSDVAQVFRDLVATLHNTQRMPVGDQP